MMKNSVDYDKRAMCSARLASLLIISLLLLFALKPLLLLWQFLQQQDANLNLQNAFWRWVIFSLPLCWFVKSTWQRKTRSALLLCLVLMVYFMGFMVTVISLGDRTWGLFGLIQVSALLIAAMLFLHWQQAHNKQTQINQSVET